MEQARRTGGRMENLTPDQHRDYLSDVLRTARFQSGVFCRSQLSAPWGLAVAAREVATFHFVVDGSCELAVPGVLEREPLAAGDLVMLPHGHAHTMRDAPGTAVT